VKGGDHGGYDRIGKTAFKRRRLAFFYDEGRYDYTRSISRESNEL